MSAAYVVRQRSYDVPSKRRSGKLTWSSWKNVGRYYFPNNAVDLAKQLTTPGTEAAVFVDGRRFWPESR
jgi:hypothetical protein